MGQEATEFNFDEAQVIGKGGNLEPIPNSVDRIIALDKEISEKESWVGRGSSETADSGLRDTVSELKATRADLTINLSEEQRARLQELRTNQGK